ncbi:MAG: methyltransferase [marine bacterium B5-7]|nr:MAG: methyltransferase [marine bacterium B5-7]
MSSTPDMESPKAIQATITYSVSADQCHQPGVYEPENRKRTPTVWNEDRMMSIFDARCELAEQDIDRTGFELASLNTDIWETDDKRPDLSGYAQELRQLIVTRTKAVEALALSIVRRGEKRSPLLFAHNDFNFDHGPEHAHAVMGERAGELDGRRFAILQTWQPIRTPIHRHPLAFCDARTIQKDDLIPEKGTFMIAFNPHHRWYYYPEMRTEEIVLFKTFDSATDGRARYAPHGSFEHPDTPPDVPARQSAESRWLLLF